MPTGLTQSMVVLSVLMLVFFVAACDPHPFYDAIQQHRYQGRDSPSSSKGSKAINVNVINATDVLLPSGTRPLQDKSLVMTKSTEQELEQPTHQIQMHSSSPFSNRFLSSSSLQLTSSLGTTIKRRSPGADAKSNKSLATIKVSKRDLHSLLHTNKSQSAGDDGSKKEMSEHFHTTPPPLVQKGVPASLLDLERGNSGDKIVLKLDKEYSPHEIADYIFTMGKGGERDITQFVWDRLQENGQMDSVENILVFFEAVQKELEGRKMQQEKQPQPKGVVGRGRTHSRRRLT